MFLEETMLQKHHIVVRITQDHYVTEWSGNLSLTIQSDGETSLEISFAESPEAWDSRDVSNGCIVSGMSADTFEFVGSAIPSR